MWSFRRRFFLRGEDTVGDRDINQGQASNPEVGIDFLHPGKVRIVEPAEEEQKPHIEPGTRERTGEEVVQASRPSGPPVMEQRPKEDPNKNDPRDKASMLKKRIERGGWESEGFRRQGGVRLCLFFTDQEPETDGDETNRIDQEQHASFL